MLYSYLKITFRNLKRQRFYAILNVMGLGIGIACVIIISIYVIQELSYDRFYQNSQNIYRINTVWHNENNTERYATSPPPLRRVLSGEIPEIQASTVLYKWGDYTLRPDNNFENVFRETNVWHAGKDFFKVLNYGLLEGDPETALVARESIVLPKSTAIRYFGKEAFEMKQILGRSLLGGKDGGAIRKITGIMSDQPPNSHLQFDLLAPAVSLWDISEYEGWEWNIMHTYVLLDKGFSDSKEASNNLSDKLHEIVKKYAIPSMGYNSYADFQNDGNSFKYVLQPLEDIHLTSDYLREMAPNGNKSYVYTFFAIGIFVLIIAAVNFMNLSTAQSSKRAKEVGVKKVLGSSKGLLIKQFLIESIFFSFIALILAFGIVEVVLAYFSDYFGIAIAYKLYGTSSLSYIILGTLSLGMLAGIYPSFYLSSFKPVKILNGKPGNRLQGKHFRNGLVIFQLVISTSLIGCTLIVKKQVNYLQNKNLGFNKDNVIIIQNDREIDERRLEFKNYLNLKPSIRNVSFSTGLPGLQNFHMRDFIKEGETEGFGIRWYEGDDSYLQTLDISIADGRGFDSRLASDSSAIILNQAAVKLLGMTDPVGKYLLKNKGANDEQKLRIIGVIKDFNYESFKTKIEPLAIEFLDNYTFKDYISIRISGEDPQSSLEIIKAAWSDFEPEVPFNYSFLDQDFNRLFKSEIRLQQIFGVFTGLGIFIACLGLIGLAAFSAESRKKEIGIRKVFGATIKEVLVLLSRGFLRMTLIGFAVASPIVYFIMNNWLLGFEYKIKLGPELFLIAGLITTLIVLITVSYQSFSAANLNPVKTLKDA